MPLVCYEVDVTKVHIVTKEEQLVGYHWQLDPVSRWGKQVRKKKKDGQRETGRFGGWIRSRVSERNRICTCVNDSTIIFSFHISIPTLARKLCYAAKAISNSFRIQETTSQEDRLQWNSLGAPTHYLSGTPQFNSVFRDMKNLRGFPVVCP
jgi:hypothetical protein